MMHAIYHTYRMGYNHMDVSSKNIMKDEDGNFILCDFGNARYSATRRFRFNDGLFAARNPLAFIDTVDSVDLWDLAILILECETKINVSEILWNDDMY